MAHNIPSFSQLLRNPIYMLAFGFGSGLVPKAPGTFGTLAAIPIYLLLVGYFSQNVYWVFLIAACILGVSICGYAARGMGVHDHPGIVWDEIAGFLLTMAWAPFSWLAVLAGFVFFRLFDILKPWPISWLDRQVHGGLGIMLDDLLAGLLAALCLQGLFWFGFLPVA